MPSSETCSGTSAVTSRPSKLIDPDCTLTTRVIALISDVFPAPLGPMSPRISPAASWSETSQTAATPPNLTEIASSERRVTAAAPVLGRSQLAFACPRPERVELTSDTLRHEQQR